MVTCGRHGASIPSGVTFSSARGRSPPHARPESGLHPQKAAEMSSRATFGAEGLRHAMNLGPGGSHEVGPRGIDGQALAEPVEPGDQA